MFYPENDPETTIATMYGCQDIMGQTAIYLLSSYFIGYLMVSKFCSKSCFWTLELQWFENFPDEWEEKCCLENGQTWEGEIPVAWWLEAATWEGAIGHNWSGG